MSNGTLPPPMEFGPDATLIDILKTFYNFSQDLLDNPPRAIVLFADTLQVNWMASGLDTGAEACTIRLKLEASPRLPASIVPALHP